jgi:hypothetical protein
MKRIAGVVVMAAFMSVSLVAMATAHTVTYDTKVTMHVAQNGSEDDFFEGEVLSNSDRCLDRTVSIFRVVEGGDDELYFGTFTDENGAYGAYTGETPAGTYYASVGGLVTRKNGKHKHVCKSAVSPEVVVAAGPPA